MKAAPGSSLFDLNPSAQLEQGCTSAGGSLGAEAADTVSPGASPAPASVQSEGHHHLDARVWVWQGPGALCAYRVFVLGNVIPAPG